MSQDLQGRPAAIPPGRTARRSRWRMALAAAAGAAMLAACGGGGGYDYNDGPYSCSTQDRQVWLRDYMNDWYFWYDISPSPSPAGYTSVDTYFQALLYEGTDPDFPADRWSYLADQDDYDRFYGDGETLGYGVMVAGLEVQGRPDQPLLVRYVEPGSPAATAGVQRGEEILSINGRPASEYIADDDYTVLSATATNQVLTLRLANDDGERTVTLTSAIYDLAPVPTSTVITTPSNRKMGYIMVKDMIDQAVVRVDQAFGQFKSQGVQDVIIDLRYNGGGLVSVADKIASFPNGDDTAGQVFTSLLYNDKKDDRHNDSFRFYNYANATGLNRVYVITGARTCSASELVINGLRPFVTVVTVGDTTCGKPVGFLPQADGCGTVVNAVNFESVNASNEGRYFDGFDATCPVAEDFSQPIGGVNDPLRIAAEDHADGFSCTTVAGARARPERLAQAAQSTGRSRVLGLVQPAQRQVRLVEPGDRGGMLAK
ncbi:S41 family peptidase [Ideonella sp.]|uniref:S41 family peptidase n=1 Tax=Ideonella sp. TaxID=1929293 RepID=UPI0035B43A8D